MNELASTFLAYSVKRMVLCEKDLDRCLDQLSEEQIWQRGGAHENSIANLLLHLDGNLRQWFLHGIDGQPDVRERDAEFAAGPPAELSAGQPASAEMRRRLSATLAECRRIVGELDPARLLTTINPQPGGGWGEPPILEAIYQIVGHLQMHTGQIVLLTKQLAGRDLDLSIPRKR